MQVAGADSLAQANSAMPSALRTQLQFTSTSEHQHLKIHWPVGDISLVDHLMLFSVHPKICFNVNEPWFHHRKTADRVLVKDCSFSNGIFSLLFDAFNIL